MAGEMARMPPNFSWVVDGLLAGMGYPRRPEHFRYLTQQGIKYLVSLTEGKPNLTAFPELVSLGIPMPDFTPPSIEQVEQFLKMVDKAQMEKTALAVHCALGQGRTGTMLACYLIQKRGLTASQAIVEIRRMRPHSIETTEQEQLVYKYEKHLKV